MTKKYIPYVKIYICLQQEKLIKPGACDLWILYDFATFKNFRLIRPLHVQFCWMILWRMDRNSEYKAACSLYVTVCIRTLKLFFKSFSWECGVLFSEYWIWIYSRTVAVLFHVKNISYQDHVDVQCKFIITYTVTVVSYWYTCDV